MILNSNSVQLIRANATRLANNIRHKEDLADLATASTFEQIFSAIETILTNSEMYFDDELLSLLDDNNWQNFRATLLVYTYNILNRNANGRHLEAVPPQPIHREVPREYGASIAP